MAETKAPRRTREEQRAQTRADLLDAAAEVFARNGYHGTSVDMVAEAAGYTKGAVYSNFESKEELFLALLEARLEDSLNSMQDVMDSAAPEDRPEAFGSRRGEISQWEPQWFMLEAEFELYAARNPEVRDRVAERQTQDPGYHRGGAAPAHRRPRPQARLPGRGPRQADRRGG